METSTLSIKAARSIVHRPHDVRLAVDGGAPGACEEGTEMVDRGGIPVLLCPPDSDLVRAARDRRTAILTVEDDRGTTVTLRGRLNPLCADVVEGREVEVVELAVVAVAMDGVDLVLAEYLREAAEVVANYADEVRDHANADHGDQLRQVAARLTGTPPGDLAGALLRRLDADGLTLAWVDEIGAHEARILFPTRALSRRQLSVLLSQIVCLHAADDTLEEAGD